MVALPASRRFRPAAPRHTALLAALAMVALLPSSALAFLGRAALSTTGTAASRLVAVRRGAYASRDACVRMETDRWVIVDRWCELPAVAVHIYDVCIRSPPPSHHPSPSTAASTASGARRLTPLMAAGKEIRVRFAPSPTGTLHVGGARTALYNYLVVRDPVDRSWVVDRQALIVVGRALHPLINHRVLYM